jgi:hypothetical protein
MIGSEKELFTQEIMAKLMNKCYNCKQFSSSDTVANADALSRKDDDQPLCQHQLRTESQCDICLSLTQEWSEFKAEVGDVGTLGTGPINCKQFSSSDTVALLFIKFFRTI